MFRAFLIGAAISVAAVMSHAATFNVFASGTIPDTPFTSGATTWEFSGSVSDDLVDTFPDPSVGRFLFQSSDVATMSFTVGGTSIALRDPATTIVGSRISATDQFISFVLDFDIADPFFGGAVSFASFTIQAATVQPGVSFFPDPNDLSNLMPFDASTDRGRAELTFLGATTGTLETISGSGNLSVARPELTPVPLPASALFLLGGVLCLLGLRRAKSAH